MGKISYTKNKNKKTKQNNQKTLWSWTSQHNGGLKKGYNEEQKILKIVCMN